jgi:hypothetical protein
VWLEPLFGWLGGVAVWLKTLFGWLGGVAVWLEVGVVRDGGVAVLEFTRQHRARRRQVPRDRGVTGTTL